MNSTIQNYLQSLQGKTIPSFTRALDIGIPLLRVKKELEQIEVRLKNQIQSFDPELIGYSEYVCINHGKRIRPALTLLSAEALTGKSTEEHLDLGLIIELVHMASLVHDDILDGAQKRRNKVTAFAKWGTELAVLLGDSLFSHALVLCTRLPHQEASKKIAEAANEVCNGEIIQTQRRFDLNFTIEDYYRVLTVGSPALSPDGKWVAFTVSRRIEATNDRWHWEVVDQKFQPRPGSEWFLNYWQQRIFDGLTITEGGYIFMPLQGKLLERRHFQARSPVDMIAATLQADPTRRILATLHPKESYSAEELAALQSFGPRFELRTQPSKPLLAGCDYVVTENSALAFSGFFARKPAVLFAEIDFHHIAGSVPRLGVAEAFRVVTRPQSYAGYLHWFLRDRAISAWSEDCKTKIVARMRGLGWPI